MTAILAAALTALVTLASLVTKPTVATCPSGAYLQHGVRPDGRFTCTFDPFDDDTDTAPREHPVRVELGGRVWCIGGSPRVDGVRVWCVGGPTS